MSFLLPVAGGLLGSVGGLVTGGAIAGASGALGDAASVVGMALERSAEGFERGATVHAASIASLAEAVHDLSKTGHFIGIKAGQLNDRIAGLPQELQNIAVQFNKDLEVLGHGWIDAFFAHANNLMMRAFGLLAILVAVSLTQFPPLLVWLWDNSHVSGSVQVVASGALAFLVVHALRDDYRRQQYNLVVSRTAALERELRRSSYSCVDIGILPKRLENTAGFEDADIAQSLLLQPDYLRRTGQRVSALKIRFVAQNCDGMGGASAPCRNYITVKVCQRGAERVVGRVVTWTMLLYMYYASIPFEVDVPYTWSADSDARLGGLSVEVTGRDNRQGNNERSRTPDSSSHNHYTWSVCGIVWC